MEPPLLYNRTASSPFDSRVFVYIVSSSASIIYFIFSQRMNDMKNVAKATQKNLKTEIDDLFKTFCERFLNKLFNTDNYKLGRAGYIFLNILNQTLFKMI